MSLPLLSSEQLLGEELGTSGKIVMSSQQNSNGMWIRGRWTHLKFFAHLLLISIAATVASSAPASSPQSADIILVPSPNTPLKTCAQIFGNIAKTEEEKMLMCQLYESSALLTQLGALINQGLDRLIVGQTEAVGQSENTDQNWNGVPDGQREKKKHEFLRFGKRKHEYLRFGKRKHEYLRFG